MSTIKLEIKKNETQVDFQAEGVQESHITQVIEGMFNELSKGMYGIVKTDLEPAPFPAVEEPVKKSTHKSNDTTVYGEPETMEEAMQLTAKPKNDVTPLHYKTGYKLADDGTKLYKTRYRCPKCKNAGNHYIPEGTTQVDCHECQTTMQVKKATPGTQGIQPDKFLNWYVAGDQLPVSQFVYGPAKRVE